MTKYTDKQLYALAILKPLAGRYARLTRMAAVRNPKSLGDVGIGQFEEGTLVILERYLDQWYDVRDSEHFVIAVQGDSRRAYLRTSCVMALTHQGHMVYHIRTENSIYKLEVLE